MRLLPLLKTSLGSKNLGRVRAGGSWCMSTMNLDCAAVLWRLKSVGGV